MKFFANKFIPKLITLAISASLIYILTQQISLASILKYLNNVSSSGIIIFSILSFTGLLLRTYRYRLFLRPTIDMPNLLFLNLTLALAIRNSVMEFLPFRMGEASIVGYLSLIKIKVIESTRALLACIFLDILSLLLFMGLALLGIAFIPDLSGKPTDYLNLLLFGILAVTIFSFLAYYLVYNIRQIGEVLSNHFSFYIEKLEHFVPNSLKHLRPFRGTKTILVLLRKTDRGEWIKGLIISLALRTLKYLSLSILFIDTIGSHSQFTEAKLYHTLLLPLCFITSEAVASLPASGFLGFGGYELSFDFSYSLFFNKIPNLTSIIFSIHLITQIVNIGTLVLIFLTVTCMKLRGKLSLSKSLTP